MKLILKIKQNKITKKERIVAWIQKNSALNDGVQQLFQLFKDKIKISKLSKFLRFYIVSSNNPAIILNIFSSLQESIPDVYFKNENSIRIEDFVDI